MELNKHDELLNLFLDKGKLGVLKIDEVERLLGVDRSELSDRYIYIQKAKPGFINKGENDKIGIPFQNLSTVKEFLKEGGFKKIKEDKLKEEAHKKNTYALTEKQIKNLEFTRIIAIIGAISGVLSLLWKIIDHF